MSESGLIGGPVGPGGPSVAGQGAIEKADRMGVAPWQRWTFIAVGLFFLLGAVRWITGNEDLTSSGTFGTTLRLAVPIGLAALGGIYSERSGVVNIGLEGMMILGTWFGAWGAWQFGPWWGVAIGIAGGAAGGLLHALATVTFGVDQIISGVAIITLAGGIARFLSVEAYDNVSGGGATQSPRVGDVGDFDMPLLSGGWGTPDTMGWVEDRHWLVVSDAAGLVKGVSSNLSYLTIIALLLVPFTWWLLWRTVFGLRLRSCGENPNAADSLGVPVYRMKYYGVVISGALSGLAGAYLSIEAAGIYRQGQTSGRGFIGLAAMIFGNWRPFGAAAGAGLFGFADALQLRNPQAVHAILLFVTLAGIALTVYYLWRRRMTTALVTGILTGLVALWYFTSDAIPSQFINMTPYVITLIVLTIASQRLRMPAADGVRWRKGQTE